MKRLTTVLLSITAVFGLLAIPLLAPAVAYADGVDVLNQACSDAGTAGSELCRNDQALFGAGSIWTNIINAIIFVVGAVAVLMIVIGGLRYVLSAGDQAAINSAKNTILYSVVGLIVAILANAIVNFTINAI